MKPPRKIVVNAPSKRYAVYCDQGGLKELSVKIRELGEQSGGRTSAVSRRSRRGGSVYPERSRRATRPVFILSSPRVWKYLGKSILRSAKLAKPRVILFNDSESAKNLATVERISRELIRVRAGRNAILVAVGGGVVGDVAGFVAACYLRGVRLVHIPTTLVAQVDSAIGGKTGVNLPEGKNLVGAFYQPDFVIADPATLRTLSDRDYRSGIYEIIKYGVIGDANLFRDLENNLDKLLRRDSATLASIIPRCIAQKARVTSADERESGLRETLNFGHTFAHALESLTRYRVFRHGEAVGWGMIAASLLGIAAANLPLADAARVIRLVRQTGQLPPLPRNISAPQLLKEMRSDKKSRGGRLRFVLAYRIGHVEIGVEVPDQIVAVVWNELLRSAHASRTGSKV
jgi:3-dehydroquinate synthase